MTGPSTPPPASARAAARPDERDTSLPDPITAPLPDVQGEADRRRVPIDRVGISGVRWPISVADAGGAPRTVAATLELTVGLDASHKGTHMSRFLQVLREHGEALGPGRLAPFLHAMRERLEAPSAHLRITFGWFLDRAAPVSGEVGPIEVRVRLDGTIDDDGVTERLTVAADATSLCPCSKEISAFGAHNQRCELTATIESDPPVGIARLTEILEGSASCAVFPVLKRPDEKYVTEAAYENPKFVEDIIRDLALRLDEESGVTRYRISSENFESIHGHNAFAVIERGLRG